MQTSKQREWYIKNRIRLIKESKIWKKSNPEKVKKSAKKYYEKNKQAIFLKNKIWKRKHYIKKPRQFHNLIGINFGRWKVLSFDHINKRHDRFWNCICDCGNKDTVSGISLVHKRSQSCGCLQKDIIRNMCQKRVGIKSPCWKGDDVSYTTLHQWLRKHFKKEECHHCGTTNKALDFALITGKEYSRNINDYITLCRKCHIKYDKKKK